MAYFEVLIFNLTMQRYENNLNRQQKGTRFLRKPSLSHPRSPCLLKRKYWIIGGKVPCNYIRPPAPTFSGERPYISERAGLYMRADAELRILFCRGIWA